MRKKQKQISNLITSNAFYIDRIVILLAEKPKSLRLRKMRKTCGHLFTKKSDSGKYQFSIDIKQPTFEALEMLNQALTRKKSAYAIGHVEFAMDFLCKNSGDAKNLDEYLKKTLYPKTKRKVTVFETENVKYWNNGSCMSLVLYSDRLSKESKTPCVHVEYRFRNEKTCRNMGFFTLDDVLDFKFRTFWKDYFLLKDAKSSTKIKTKPFFKRTYLKKI